MNFRGKYPLYNGTYDILIDLNISRFILMTGSHKAAFVSGFIYFYSVWKMDASFILKFAQVNCSADKVHRRRFNSADRR